LFNDIYEIAADKYEELKNIPQRHKDRQEIILCA
jgi:hypothetical protein